MKPARLSTLFALAALAAPLAGCASGPEVYPQPYIGSGAPIAPAPQDIAAFKARSLHAPPKGDVQDLAESYIASAVAHPSSVRFKSEFESIGKSIALCGLVNYRDTDGQMSGWRPFFVEWTAQHAKGLAGPPYNPDDELVKLCGPLATMQSE
jgi:hypothetical protein